MFSFRKPEILPPAMTITQPTGTVEEVHLESMPRCCQRELRAWLFTSFLLVYINVVFKRDTIAQCHPGPRLPTSKI